MSKNDFDAAVAELEEGDAGADFWQDAYRFAIEARRARDAEARMERIIEDAPHGALCKRGLKNLYDPGGKRTCWKRTQSERTP